MDVLQVEKPSYMTEDLEIFSDALTKFIERECLPHEEEWRKAKMVPRELWTKAGEMGLLCPSMPEAYGGWGGSYAHDAVILERLGRLGFDSWGISLHNAIVAPYILNHGTEEQKKDWLPRLASGELVGAIAMSEPGTGSDLQGVKTTAVRDGNEYVINGSKTFITNGGTANFIIVVAKTDPKEGSKGVSLIGVETDKVDGFRRGRILEKVGAHMNDTAELFFDDVRVPTMSLIGPDEGQGFYQLMQELPQERLNVVVGGMAAIERALEETIAYVKERKAFGQRVIDFQNTQFTLAECKTKATVAKVFVNDCVTKHIDGKLDTVTASMAKLWVTDLQCEIIDECLQLFGGYGYMTEYPIARMYQDARVQRIYAGTNEIMKLMIARSL